MRKEARAGRGKISCILIERRGSPGEEEAYLVRPDDAARRRVGAHAAVEVDVVALDDRVRVQVAAELQFGDRRDCR